MDTQELEQIMAHCYGTENYYTNQFLHFKYTDGVKVFCEKVGAYWLLDLVESILRIKAELHSDLIGITLRVKDQNKAKLTFKKGTKLIYKQDIPFTDCPKGKWKFFYQGDVFFWNMEY